MWLLWMLEGLTVYKYMGILIGVLALHSVAPGVKLTPLAVLLAFYEPVFGVAFVLAGGYARKTHVVLQQHGLGSDMATWLVNFLTTVWDLSQDYGITVPLTFVGEAYMIDADPTADLDPVRDFVKLTPDEATLLRHRYAETSNRNWYALLGLVAFIVSVLGGPIFGLGVFVLMTFIPSYNTFHEEVKMAHSDGKLLDGVYRLERQVFFGRHWAGIGVCWKGVMHAKKHLMGGVRTLVVNGHTYERYYCDASQDLVTWGGMPTIRNPSDGEQCLVKSYTPDGRRFCSTSPYSIMSESLAGIQSTQTMPGSSGSPVYFCDDQGVFHFAGQLGNSLRSEVEGTGLWSRTDVQYDMLPRLDFKHTEYDHVRPLAEGGNRQIFQPPGTGKTRRHVPQLVKEALDMDKRVVVTAPTRVIVRDIVKLLRGEGIKVKDLSRGGESDKGARVMVAPHAVMLNRILHGEVRVVYPTLYIVDETHMPATETIFLVHFLRHLCGQSANRKSVHQLVELTATGYSFTQKKYEIHAQSNHEVTMIDYPNTWEGFTETLAKLSKHQGQKVVVFCSRVRGGSNNYSIEAVKSYLQTLGDGVIILPFYRKNFVDMAKKVEQPCPPHQTMFVLTTNMSEVGINMDLDVVVDPMRQMTFCASGDEPHVFRRKIQCISQAAQVQRQGRVGRMKGGVYYSPEGVVCRHRLYHNGSVEVAEANAICEAMNLPTMGEPMELTTRGVPPVSIRQVRQWARGRVSRFGMVPQTLTGTYYLYDSEGRERSREQLAYHLRSISSSVNATRVTWRGVDLHLIYFDERDGELICAMFKEAGLRTRNLLRDDENDDYDWADIPRNPLCLHKDGTVLTGVDHSNMATDREHSHLCLSPGCGHVYTHIHDINPESMHGLNCPCH